MLSDVSRPVIEATLPAVGANVGEIARRFYPHMFGAHPELLDGVFNRGNQARGEQQQSLAGSVASFASGLVETPPRTPEIPRAGATNGYSDIAHRMRASSMRHSPPAPCISSSPR